MAATTEAKEALQDYVKNHKIDELIKELLQGLLTETPEMKPKEHWAKMLRLEQTVRGGEESIKGEKGLDANSSIPARELHRLLEAAKRITAEIVPQKVVKLIISETIRLLQCDRVYLFVYDSRDDMLVLQASHLDAPINVNLGGCLASQVLTTRKPVNIPECNSDPGCDTALDKLTGYSSRSILAVPIIDFEGECQGVLQVVNKLADEFGSTIDMPAFTGVDEAMLGILAQPVSTALHNADVFRTIAVSADRGNALLGMIRSLSQNLGQQSAILAISLHARKMAQASHCTVFLVDEGRQQLWSIASDCSDEMRVPKSAGLVGKCATFGIVVIEDDYANSRLGKMDTTRPFETTSVLAVPVFRQQPVSHGERQVLAVIELVNKTGGDGEVCSFTKEDIQGMETFALLLSSKLEGLAVVQSERRPSVEQTEVIHGLHQCPGIGSPNAKHYFAELTAPELLSPDVPGSPHLGSNRDRRSVVSGLDAVIFEEDEQAQEQSESDKGDGQEEAADH